MDSVIALAHVPALEPRRVFELFRAGMVCACALALILAGHAPPF